MIHLYIKTHCITGLKYFGKTTNDPYKYSGSGKHWLAHLRKHGKNFTTEIYGSYEDQAEATAAALEFSTKNNIVRSPEWANMIVENALDGAPNGHEGHKFTDEELRRISEASKTSWEDPDRRDRTIATHCKIWATEERQQKHQEWLALHWTDERRQHQREVLRGRKNPKLSEATKGKKKHDGFGALVSAAMKGQPKTRCSRIFDRREMAVFQFTRWLNQLPSEDTSD